MNLRIARSLRAKFLLVVSAGVVVPLAVVGLWLTRATERSGRDLLRTRLDGALVQVVNEVSGRWVVARAALLDMADDAAVRSTLGGISPAPPRIASMAVGSRARSMVGEGARDPRIVLGSADGRARWTLRRAGDSIVRLVPVTDGATDVDGIVVVLPVTARNTGASLGTIEAHLPVESLVPAGVAGTGGIGAVLGIADRTTGVWLANLPFDPALLKRDEFDLAGERWLVARRTLEEPRLLLAAAAPLAAYTAPFESAARRGALALFLVCLAALTLAAVFTRRLTHSLERLAVAADAVSEGDLEHRVDVPNDDEVGRVARAFNGMVESLRSTLGQLARRERLAAVGEFAASLAHEVRNPLTSIRVNLQRVEEQVPPDSALRTPLERALHEVSRLDRTVSAALRVARSGTPGTDLVDLRAPLDRALEVTAPAFEQARATLEAPDAPATSLLVRGDAAALEQLFLNLLLNAAQSLPSGGRITVSAAADDAAAEVSIRDTGRGIPHELLGRIFEPFFTTTKEGTGLGLAIARQIAIAHGGTLDVESEPGVGTTARVRLPLLSPETPAGLTEASNPVTK